MFKTNRLLRGIIASIVVAMGAAAEMPPEPGGGGFPGVFPGGFPGFGQADGLADIQALIRASNEEWKVISLKARTVMAARSAVEAGIDASGISSNANQAVRSGPRGGQFPMGGMPTNDSFEGPGTVGPGASLGGWIRSRRFWPRWSSVRRASAQAALTQIGPVQIPMGAVWVQDRPDRTVVVVALVCRASAQAALTQTCSVQVCEGSGEVVLVLAVCRVLAPAIRSCRP